MRVPTLNKAQQKALWALYRRDTQGNYYTQLNFRGYRAIRRAGHYDTLCDCFMVPLWNIWIGIEKDGYTHS